MPTIYDRSRPAEADKVLSMSGEEIARTISIPSTWRHLRIGILHEISRSTGTDISNPLFAFGLTAGSSSLYGDAVTNHFIGVSAPAQTAPYQSGWTIPAYTALVNVIKKEATTVTTWASNVNWQVGTINTTASMYRNILFVDFIRPPSDPGTMHLRTYTPHAANTNLNVAGQETQDNFDLWMTQITSSAIQTDITPVFLPVSESIYGSLNTVNIYWGTVNPPVEISKVSVYRFA